MQAVRYEEKCRTRFTQRTFVRKLPERYRESINAGESISPGRVLRLPGQPEYSKHMKEHTSESWQDALKSLNAEYGELEKALIDDYFQFLRFESISADPSCKPQTRACAEFVAAHLKTSGLHVEVWETSGQPAVYAEWLGAGPTQPTVLIYNHYDVQPCDPLNLWETPPFEPSVRGGQVYARGAQDNKGQCIPVLAVLRHLLKRDGKLPINVKVIVEGEEETGSRGLVGLLPDKGKRMSADYLMVVDMGIPGPGIPSLTLGLRGISTMTMELEGSNTDLHSGVYGGIVYNPNRALVEMLGALYDSEGRVTVPGFYDDVAELTEKDRETIEFEHDISVYEQTIGAKATGGEKAYSPLESAWVRPTLEINGVGGGYSGEGFKTVIPAKAIAKLSCRLVPNQVPQKIIKQVEAFLRARVPDGITMTFSSHGEGAALRTEASSPLVEATAEVLGAVLGKKTQKILCGGSVPVVAELARATGTEVILLGYGLDSDNMHAPNEHFGIDRLKHGFVTMGALLERYARIR